jgi:hypothetical protein
MATHIASPAPRVSPHAGHHQGGFLRHLVEMTIAMMVGMAAAVPVLWALLAALGVETADEATADYPELICLVVAAGMVTTMVAWMRHRGHAWRPCAEMAVAMAAPLVPIFALLWAGVVPGDSACGVYCVAMVPAMLAAMLLRRGEYGRLPRHQAMAP